MKAFLSDSLSIVLMATSLPFHLALHTTPNAPLPTTYKTHMYENITQIEGTHSQTHSTEKSSKQT